MPFMLKLLRKRNMMPIVYFRLLSRRRRKRLSPPADHLPQFKEQSTFIFRQVCIRTLRLMRYCGRTVDYVSGAGVSELFVSTLGIGVALGGRSTSEG